jgi:hypothetical protein
MRADAVHRVELGRDIDDAAPTGRDHRRRHPPRQPVGGDVVGGDDIVDDLVADLPEPLQAVAAEPRRVDIGKGEPGIVDQDVDFAKALSRRRHDPVAFAGIAQIGDQRVEAPAQLQLLGLDLHLGDIALDMPDGDHRVAGPRQAEAHRPPQPAQPAGDQRDPALAIVGHSVPPVGFRQPRESRRRGITPRL